MRTTENAKKLTSNQITSRANKQSKLYGVKNSELKKNPIEVYKKLGVFPTDAKYANANNSNRQSYLTKQAIKIARENLNKKYEYDTNEEVQTKNRHREIKLRIKNAYRELDVNKNSKITIDIDGLIKNPEDRSVMLRALGNRQERTTILTDNGVGYTTRSFENFDDVSSGNWGWGGDNLTSDEMFAQSLPNNKSLTVSNVISNLKSNKNRSGNFFKYTLKPVCDKLMEIINFNDFQIYTSVKDEVDNCFLYSLKMSGKIDDDTVNKLKIFVKNKTVRKKDFPIICDLIKLNIGLRFERTEDGGKTKTNNVIFGKYEDTIYINLIDEHYFIEKEVNITKYALENYEEIKNEKVFNNIYNKLKQKKKDRYIKSYDLVKYLIDNEDKFLNKITLNDSELWNTNFIEEYVDNCDITNLEYDDNCIKEPENIALDWDGDIMNKSIQDAINEKNSKIKNGLMKSLDELNIGVTKSIKQDKTGKEIEYVNINIFTDFETTTDDENHKEYMMCALLINENNKKISFKGIGENCCVDVLNQIRNYVNDKKYDLKYTNITLLFHNAKYDVNFLISKCEKIQYLENGTQFVCADMSYKGLKLKVKDSYKLLPFRLADFGKIFNLSVKKEILPYKQYSNSNVKKHSLNLYYETLLTGFKNSDVYEYVKNMIIWDCIVTDDDDILDTLQYNFHDEKYNPEINYLEILKNYNEVQFNHIKYSLKYCEMDCDVLQKGYTTFRKWILDMPDIISPDINNILTLPSLAFKIFEENGCYDDVYQVGGIVQHFINKTIVGGRVMCVKNQKLKVGLHTNNDYVVDFDGVSLYPSSYVRLDGFLKGTPKIIKDNSSYDDIKSYDGYFVEIKVKSVGIKRNMPLGSFVNKETKTRNFTNDIINKTLFLDKTGLEDLIMFQDITFDVIRGYYFDEGFNEKAVGLMRKIFNERLRLKKEKNPAEQGYKLLMNSAYGKNIRKQSFTNTVICDNEEEFNKNMDRNYNFNRRFWKFGDKYRIETMKGLDFHYNYAHIGACILSMSKRIMNEVICCGEDIGIDVYYQDTDSIHILKNDIDKLDKAYRTKYNRELIGKGLGQFHTDFTLNYDGKSYSDNVFSRKFIGLGKKCYIDELVLLDNEGKPTLDCEGKEILDYHIRLKGVSNKAIIRRCEELECNPLELYEMMYNGEKIEFDLLLGNDNETSFAFGKNMTVSTRRNEVNEDGDVTKYKFMRSVVF